MPAKKIGRKLSSRERHFRRYYVQVGGRPRQRWVNFQYGNQTFNVGPVFGSMAEAVWFADQFAKCLSKLVAAYEQTDETTA